MTGFLRPALSVARSNPLSRRLRELMPLTPAEVALLDELATNSRARPAQSLISPGGVLSVPQVVLSGWGCRRWYLRDGRCQIVSFLLPGDCIGLQVTPNDDTLCSAIALTPMTTADAEPLTSAGAAITRHAGLARAIGLMKGLDDYLLRCHIVRLGRQTAYERTVHLFLELEARLGMVGQVSGNSFAMPLTQETLADALGLSIVHFNRTLQQIRRDGLLELRGGLISILRRDAMESVADWTPLVPARQSAYA